MKGGPMAMTPYIVYLNFFGGGQGVSILVKVRFQVFLDRALQPQVYSNPNATFSIR